MAVVSSGPAPYSPTSPVLAIVQGYRSRGWSPPFNLDLVQKAGVTASLAPRVLQSLRLLDLIDGDGNPTPAFEGLRRVPQSDFQTALAAIIKTAYAEVFQFVDPATETDERIRDQFRSYEPLGQLNRMVSLFLGLCVEAGLRTADASKSQPAARKSAAGGRRTTLSSHDKIKRGLVRLASGTTRPYERENELALSNLPPALAGLLASLPKPGDSWTREARDRFVSIFPGTLDFCYPVSTTVIGGDVAVELTDK